MTARHKDIADAVVGHLNGLTLSQAFTAARAAIPVWMLEAVRTLTVDVLIGRYEQTLQNRGGLFDRRYTVDIVVQDALDVADTTDLDAAILLCEEIQDSLTGQTMSNARLMTVDREQTYDTELAEAAGQFVAVISATFRQLT